jgi:hypothetical protein
VYGVAQQEAHVLEALRENEEVRQHVLRRRVLDA